MSNNDVTQFPHISNFADPQGMYQRVQEYLHHMDVKNYWKATRESREFYLDTFLEWSGQRQLLRPGEITKPILERFQRYLFHYRRKDGNPLTFRSQYNRLVAIRAWFKWLSKENYILYNPASEIELLKLEKRLPKAVLSEGEAGNVLNQPDIEEAMGASRYGDLRSALKHGYTPTWND